MKPPKRVVVLSSAEYGLAFNGMLHFRNIIKLATWVVSALARCFPQRAFYMQILNQLLNIVLKNSENGDFFGKYTHFPKTAVLSFKNCAFTQYSLHIMIVA